MFTRACPFFLMVETPLHAGSGTDLGVVDLPIQRERHTGFPKIEASGLKGSIREAFERFEDHDDRQGELEKRFPSLKGDRERYRKAISLVFGPESGDLHVGALGFTDARLLLFPVRSARGIFAWITCPAVLNRLCRELEMARVSPLPPVTGAGTVPPESDLLVRAGTVVLEEYAFTVREDDEAGKLAQWLAEMTMPQEASLSWWRDRMKKGLVVLPDDDFRDLTTLATEVTTRIKIDPDTGTVQSGALFTEEYLPQESLLYGLVLASPVFGREEDREICEAVFGKEKQDEAVLKFWRTGMPKVLQVGGNATLGKGLVRIKVWGD